MVCDAVLPFIHFSYYYVCPENRKHFTRLHVWQQKHTLRFLHLTVPTAGTLEKTSNLYLIYTIVVDMSHRKPLYKHVCFDEEMGKNG